MFLNLKGSLTTLVMIILIHVDLIIFENTFFYRADFLTVKNFKFKFSNGHNFKFQRSKIKKKIPRSILL